MAHLGRHHLYSTRGMHSHFNAVGNDIERIPRTGKAEEARRMTDLF